MSHADGHPILLQHAYTEAEWSAANPVLMDRETGWTTDTRRVKLGDGLTAWNDLPYAIDPGTGTQAQFVSTDGSFGLGTPTGVGGEFIITADVLEDITFDGVSL
jgi:hypothetical protein